MLFIIIIRTMGPYHLNYFISFILAKREMSDPYKSSSAVLGVTMETE